MASAFNTSVSALEDELTHLILDGQISARIDSHAKVVEGRKEGRGGGVGGKGGREGEVGERRGGEEGGEGGKKEGEESGGGREGWERGGGRREGEGGRREGEEEGEYWILKEVIVGRWRGRQLCCQVLLCLSLQVMYARQVDQRSAIFQKALEVGEAYQLRTKVGIYPLSNEGLSCFIVK